MASLDQLLQDANLQNWTTVDNLIKYHPRKGDFIWNAKEMYHNLGVDNSAYENDARRWPYQDMWDRFTTDLPVEVAKERGYKVDMLNWVMDETKPNYHLRKPWKHVHPANVFHNAKETFGMGNLGFNKFNGRSSNRTRLESKPVFPYRNHYQFDVNQNNIKNDFGYKESLGWLTTYLPEKIDTGFSDENFLCKKMKFPFYKDPNHDCQYSDNHDDADCQPIELDFPIQKSFLVAQKQEISDFTFQDDFMVVGHESYERLADKLFFNIIENCRYNPQLPLNEIERQQVFLKFAKENNATFPSWREPLINQDLASGISKVIPHQTPICKESFAKKSYTFGVAERHVAGGCKKLHLHTQQIAKFDQPLRDLNAEIAHIGAKMTLNGQPNSLFGGYPSDRHYTMKHIVQQDASVAFHGCPAIHNGKMLIFGGGPDMKQYMKNMYLDYSDYESFTRAADQRECQRNLGANVEKYFADNVANYPGQTVVDDKNKFNRMFNYLLNYKNCEAEDLEYTNLYLATVKSKNDGVVFEDISQKFYNTNYATTMKQSPTTAKHIGYYSDKRAHYDLRMIYSDWEETMSNTESDVVGTVYDNCGNSTCLPVFQWSYFFNYQEVPYSKENTIEEAIMNFTTFDQNPIFNKRDAFDALPSNLQFNTRCWLPDKFVDDYLERDDPNKYGDKSVYPDVLQHEDDAESKGVMCPKVHPRFDHDWNFRFLKGELTELPDMSVYNKLLEKYFKQRMDARTLLGTWSRSDYATVDRPKPSWRWKAVYNPLLSDGNNNQGHYTGASTPFDQNLAGTSGPKGDAVVTSRGLFPYKSSHQFERADRPHPFKMFVLNNTGYDREMGVVVSPDSNVTSVFGDDKHISFDPTIGKENELFAKEFFKTGVLEAFFDKNSALEWPTGYMDSLTPGQRYTPIRMLFNDVMDETVGFTDKNVLALNNYRGLRKADDQLILDRALPTAWFHPIDGSDPAVGAVKLSKLMLGMYAAHQIATKTTNPTNVPEYSNESKFEKRPRRSVDLADFMADPATVGERIDDLDGVSTSFKKWYQYLDANNPNQIGFGDVLDFAKEEASNTFTPYTEQQLAARDARRWNSLIQGETDQWKKPFDTGLNPLDFGNFTYVPELDSRVNMKTTLPGGNDFITKPWYDLSIYEKFGFLPKYEMPNVDAIEIFSGRSVPDVNQTGAAGDIYKKGKEFTRDIFLPEHLLGVAEHPYYLDISRCHDTNWYAGKPHCPNGPKLIDWFLSDGGNKVPLEPYTFALTEAANKAYVANVAKQFPGGLLNRLPLEHTYDEILSNPATAFLSTHDLFDTLMQNGQDGLQMNFQSQHSDRAVQKDNYRSEREGNKNHEFSAYVGDGTGAEVDLQKYLNTWQEFVHPDFDPQVDIRAQHPITLSNMATDHIRAVFEKANKAISQHRYLNLPQNATLADGSQIATGLNFTEMMMDFRDWGGNKDLRYVHQVESQSIPKYEDQRGHYFVLDTSTQNVANDWWNSATLSSDDKFDVDKDGIKQRTAKQNTDVLAILKRQYEQALLSAMQNVQLTPTVETFELTDCGLDHSVRSPLCYDDYLQDSAFDPDNVVKESFNSSTIDDIDTIMASKTGKAPYLVAINKRGEIRGSKWGNLLNETDSVVFLEHVYKVNSEANPAKQVRLGDIFRPAFENTVSINRGDFMDQMLNLNKPCPQWKGEVMLFGRIRKTQEIVSKHTDHQCSSCYLSEIKDKLSNLDEKFEDFRQEMTKFTDLENEVMPIVSTEQTDTAYYDQYVEARNKQFFQGPKIRSRFFEGVSGKDWGGSVENDRNSEIYKSYPHPYSLAFTYNAGSVDYRGMLPNSLSPQWGACVVHTFETGAERLLCFGGMLCHTVFKRNAGLHHSTYSSRRDDAFMCDNLDDAPHNIVISPKFDGADKSDLALWDGSWESSIDSENDELFPMRLPIGLLGHSALVINGKIHIFGGMFSKLSSFSGYHFSRVDESNNIIQSRYYHDDVSDMVLIYQEAQSTWSRGHTMKQRRFGHSSILYARGLYHIGGGLNYKSSAVNNGAERWDYSYGAAPVVQDDQSAMTPFEGSLTEEAFKWVGDAVLQSRLMFHHKTDSDKQQYDRDQEQHVLGRAHPIRDFYLRTKSITAEEAKENAWIDEFDDVDQHLDFFFDHPFKANDIMFYAYNVTKFIANISDSTGPDGQDWSGMIDGVNVTVPSINIVGGNGEIDIENIWSDDVTTGQYPQTLDKGMYMEAPREVFPSMIKFAPCKFCPDFNSTAAFNPRPSSLKLIQQTYKDMGRLEYQRPPLMRRIMMMPNKLPKATEFNWQFNMNYKDDESAFEVIGKMPNFQAIVFPLDLSNLDDAEPYSVSQDNYLRSVSDDSMMEYMKESYPRWSCPNGREHINTECEIITT